MMTQEHATGRDVVLAIVDNMRQSLEPLVTETLAPSLYQVYLHRDDFDHLRTIFGKLESEARTLLDRELEGLNRRSTPALRRVVSKLRGEAAAARRVARAGGGWKIHFQEDPDGSLQPGEIEVVSELALRPSEDYGTGSETRRISATRGTGTMRTQRQVRAEEAWARIRYEDHQGPRIFLMTQDEIVIGREAAVDFWVDLQLKTYLDISREHARIRRDRSSGHFQIKDLSLLGTTVNGAPVPSSREVVDGEERDRDRWIELPERARIGLAGVVTLEFEKIE